MRVLIIVLFATYVSNFMFGQLFRFILILFFLDIYSRI